MMPVASLRSVLIVYGGACLVAAAGGAFAQAPDAAGRFLSASGDVRVVGRDGASRAATRATEVREGDTIVTGANALGQLRMADGALMSIRADTEMKLDRFAYSGKENDPNASFLMSVVKGGFRTITGFIGRANRNAYRVQTPTATIGVRGTDYELVHVIPQTAGGADPGTYNRVYEGVTSIQNAGGATLLVSRNQTAFAPLQGTTPPVLVTPPASIFGRPTPPPAGPRSQRPEEKGQDRGQLTARPVGGDPIAPVGARPALLNPLDSPRIISPIETAPAVDSTRVLSPIQTTPTTTLTAPTTLIAPTTTIDTTLTTTIQTAPTTTLTAPTTTTLTAPSTTLIAPTTTLTAPTTTLTAPTTTLIAPSTTTTIAPTTTVAPTTTIQTAPTTIQTAPTIRTITR
jgi:hypothetical protein